ncbi:Arylsulfatase [Maioricimonas rarisocia]|uniref:Arylsulfatase n=1 Tax=Maioricimonas rarisocia TaxID=2528026 RepID=A0A517Z340_9PLAN|nr:sulfatase [Maioricimonas rarisocia]QDU36914.1 Arylsulfatase [Maioricimonas rarisocia]
MSLRIATVRTDTPLLMLACLCLLFIPQLAVSAETDRPNVLLITVDDMNCDSVGVFGCEVPGITPNIDRLARSGMRFEHAHVTIAICQPTRAVWMTGRYPHRNGALGFDPINKDVPTLLEALHDAGYYTGIMAKVPHVVPTRGDAWDAVVKSNELGIGRDPEKYYRRSADIIAAAKVAGQPFFLMANSQDPHRPFAGSAQERQQARPRKNRPARDYPGVRRTYSRDEVTVPGFLPDLPDVRQEMTEYFASVHRADEIVGAVLRALEESGEAEGTLVMFLSDHGMPLPFAKTNCWFHSTRTPWIVRWPGVVASDSHDTEHMISGIDLAPTILDALGLPPLEGMDGRSFLPVLEGEQQSGRDFVITHINRTSGKNEYPMRSVITRQYGYIYNGWSDGQTRFRNESQNGLTMKAMIRAAENDPAIAARVQHFLYRTPEEFYDYQTDPDALVNLIDDPAHAARLDEHRQKLLEHMEATDDPQLEAFREQLASER